MGKGGDQEPDGNSRYPVWKWKKLPEGQHQCSTLSIWGLWLWGHKPQVSERNIKANLRVFKNVQKVSQFVRNKKEL